MSNTLKIKPISGSIDSTTLVLILLGLTITNFVVALYRLYYANDTAAYLLLVLFIGMLVWTSYCAAYLIRILYITDSKFILRRPYAKFWIRRIKTDQLHLNLSDISTVIVQKDPGFEDRKKGNWKITLKNRASVTFRFIADPENFTAAMNRLKSKGISVQIR